jgi:hypothetical protein
MNASSRGGLSSSKLRIGLPLVLLPLLSGCLTPTSYVDTALPVVRAEQLKPASPAGPVQLMFEFRSRGTPSAGVTAKMKPVVVGAVEKSGLFSQLSDTPVPGGRMLTIVIDNVKVDEDKTGQAVGTGLTFGLVGTMVTDGYVCNATYRSASGKTSSTTLKHALHTTIGNASGPAGVPPVKPIEGVTQIVDQLTLNALKTLRQQGL